MKRLDIIQVIRFFGAVIIFAGHAKYWTSSSVYAVELFSVISGYIIVYSTHAEDSKRDFLIKRIIRILPLYWLFTFLMYVIIYIQPSLSVSSEAVPAYLIKSLFFIPFVNKGYNLPILGVGWTLNYEMFFYLIFYVAMRINHKYRALLTVVGSFLLVMTGLVFHPQNMIFSYYTNSFLLEFSMGILSFYLIKSLQPKLKGKYVQLICGSISCLAFFWLVLAPHTNSIIPRCIHSGIPAFVCVCTALLAWNDVKMPKLLVKCGDMTYSFYLIELFTAAFCTHIMKNMTFMVQTITILIVLAITLVCSYISYQMIEVRFTDFLKRKCQELRAN